MQAKESFLSSHDANLDECVFLRTGETRKMKVSEPPASSVPKLFIPSSEEFSPKIGILKRFGFASAPQD
jgi:hypothetical protein